MKVNVFTHGQGTPVVFFHGWGFDSQIWHSLLPALHASGAYKIYFVDLPGFGQTPYMDWDTFKAALLPRLPLQFAIAGWSMGGLFATRLAIEEPSRITHLVNIASSPRFTQTDNWPGIDGLTLQGFYENLRQDPHQTWSNFIKIQLHGQDTVRVALPKPPTSTALYAGLRVLSEWDLRTELHTVTKPVCYFFGRLDAITSRRIMVKMQADYPDFEYVLFPKAAHVPFLSHASDFIAELGNFLK